MEKQLSELFGLLEKWAYVGQGEARHFASPVLCNISSQPGIGTRIQTAGGRVSRFSGAFSFLSEHEAAIQEMVFWAETY
jgi:hypothetical protein